MTSPSPFQIPSVVGLHVGDRARSMEHVGVSVAKRYS